VNAVLAAYYSTFASKSLDDSLQFEIENGLNVISKESIAGAKKFVTGLGKHGKFNVADVPEQEWQKEFRDINHQYFFSRGVLRYFTQTWRNNSFRCLFRRLPRPQDVGHLCLRYYNFFYPFL
jgi:hypothetical protein